MGLFDHLRSLLDNKLNVEQRFDLVREAVSGTMSSFYMARDKKTGEVVGLKLLDVEKTNFFESRFRGLSKPSEGEIAASLDHPRIVKTLEYGMTTKGEQYVLMEYLAGAGLHVLIKEKSPLLQVRDRRLQLVQQMADSLNAVHKAGYIHRDICPRNYICNEDASTVKLIDFGLSVPATPPFMQPGNRTGTPNYMAPEIVRRRATDHRIDLFSLGVTSYQLCTLQLPWPGQDVTGKAAMLHDTKQPINIFEVRPELHPDLGKLIMRCLEIQPEKRPRTVEEFLRALERIPSETAS